MDITITDGVVLMPAPFSAGLEAWSYEDGTPGSGSYAGQANAAYVPADQDFGGCMELQKTSATQKLRYMGETPILPGVYLRVSARVKAMSGNLPTLRIGAWAGDGSGTAVGGVPLFGPQVTLGAYGEVVTVSAIVGVGNRPGVDMAWGRAPTKGHFGLDLTGPTSGVVRIDDITIEDVTDVFARKLMDWVDVRDYGAKGDGITDDAAAFEAADAAASGRAVLVSSGTYYLGGNVTFENPVRFEGSVSMPAAARLSCTRSFDLDTYEAAFGSETEGFRRMLQALFAFTDHTVLDLGGRQVQISAPIDVAAAAGVDSFSVRRVITNGQISLKPGGGWDDVTATAVASYDPAQPYTLSGIANAAVIPVGARVGGTGVGREVYVAGVNVGAGTVTLSQPLWGAAGVQSYSFTRFAYALDFSGFQRLDKFEIRDLEFYCSGRGSALMLPPSGTVFRISGCVFSKPKDRAITSIGSGCQGMLIDETQFLSNEQSLRAQDRASVALNVNSNDTKIRDNRIVRFRHFAVMNGTGHMLIGNHFFQGDSESDGVRLAGLVLTGLNIKTTVTANYIDNCFIEWTNEHDPAPEFASEYSFGGLSVTGNLFTANDVAPSFRWIVVTPKGPGHYIQGLTVSNNVFRTFSGTVERVEMVDTSVAGLDLARMRNCVFENNSFNGVGQQAVNPVVLEFAQNTAAATWTLDPSAYLPFGGWARYVTSVVAEGALTDAGGAARHEMPHVSALQGAGRQQVALNWPVAVQGNVLVTTRIDNPN